MKNSVTVIKLTSNQTVIKKEAISLPCFPNDFIIVSHSIVVTCNDTSQNHYCVGTSCSNIPADLNDGVTPIVYSGIRDGNIEGLVIATTNSHQLVTYIDSDSRRRLYILPDGCSEPLDLSRQGSAILLTCTNETQYWVNITNDLGVVDFHQINSNLGELLALSVHGFAIFLQPAGSQSQLTLQNVITNKAVTQTVHIDHTNHIVFADFSTDGRYAFVAVNSIAVLFICVTEAIANNGGQHFHTMTTTHPLCTTCPAVKFLTVSIAVISTYDTERQFTTLSVLLLTQWPPCAYVERILSSQPKQYWLNPKAPLPASCSGGPSITTTTTTSASSSSVITVPPGPTNMSTDSGLSSGAIAGIVVGSTLLGLLFVIILACGANILYRYTKNQSQLMDAVNPTYQ